MRTGRTLWISALSLSLLGVVSLAIPLLFPVPVPPAGGPATRLITVAVLTAMVLFVQPWRVAIRGTRGDVSISMAIDVATMLLLHPFVSAAGSALGTALYHLFGGHAWPQGGERRPGRALVRGVVTFAAVALGGWLFRALRPGTGDIYFASDWLAIGTAIATRLGVRSLFYPLGMAALRSEPVQEQLRYELHRLPLVPFLLTTTLGGTAALIWQQQPAAIVLLLGPLFSTWAATQEFSRLNELLATLEDKVADRTARLGETVLALERRLAESEALYAVDRAMVAALNPEQVLTVIARESVRVTGGDQALVTLLSEDGDRQFVRAVYGPGMDDYLGTELPTEGSLTGWVIKTGEPGISVDPPRDPRLNQNMVRSGGWTNVIEAPLRSKDRVLGVLVVSSARGVCFDEQHIRLLTLLANQAGLVLENARLHAKSREVAVLEERNRLARELHDSVTQVLFGLTLNLEAAAGLIVKKPERAASLVGRSQEMAGEALAEMRSLIFELRPAALQEKGLAMALTNHINLFRRRQGLETSLSLEGDARLPPEMEFCLYRVAQEALNNVAKHARARQVTVLFAIRDGQAVLRVTDDGVGFDPAAGPGAQSFGMLGMRERLEEVHGELIVKSAPGEGTTIEARIPLHSGGDPA